MSSGLTDLDTGVVGRELPAWHGQFRVEAGLMTAEQAADWSGLAAWGPTLEPSYDRLGNALPGRHRVVRTDLAEDDPARYLGREVRGGYEVLSNAAGIAVVESILAVGQDVLKTDIPPSIDCAFSLYGGAQVVVSVLLPESIRVRDELVSEHLGVSWGHGGEGGFEGALSGIRRVCANTLRASIRGAQSRVTFRHSASIKQRAEEAARTLGLARGYFTSLQAVGTLLASVKVKPLDVRSYAADVLGVDSRVELTKGKVSTRSANQLDRIVDLWGGQQPGAESDASKGTAWGAVQAITDWADWHRSIRVSEGSNQVDSRAGSILFGTGAALKESAWAYAVRRWCEPADVKAALSAVAAGE